MTEWVELNGGRIEKEFLALMVADARKESWQEKVWDFHTDHTHCVICWAPIPDRKDPDATFYHATRDRWLCAGCYCRFMKIRGALERPLQGRMIYITR